MQFSARVRLEFFLIERKGAAADLLGLHEVHGRIFVFGGARNRSQRFDTTRGRSATRVPGNFLPDNLHGELDCDLLSGKRLRNSTVAYAISVHRSLGGAARVGARRFQNRGKEPLPYGRGSHPWQMILALKFRFRLVRGPTDGIIVRQAGVASMHEREL